MINFRNKTHFADLLNYGRIYWLKNVLRIEWVGPKQDKMVVRIKPDIRLFTAEKKLKTWPV